VHFGILRENDGGEAAEEEWQCGLRRSSRYFTPRRSGHPEAAIPEERIWPSACSDRAIVNACKSREQGEAAHKIKRIADVLELRLTRTVNPGRKLSIG
jgi:hypothetical protein